MPRIELIALALDERDEERRNVRAASCHKQGYIAVKLGSNSDKALKKSNFAIINQDKNNINLVMISNLLSYFKN